MEGLKSSYFYNLNPTYLQEPLIVRMQIFTDILKAVKIWTDSPFTVLFF